MTAIYSTRLIYLTFHGKSKIQYNDFYKIKEAPLVMIIPLFLLSVGAVFSGFLFYNIAKYNKFWNNSIYNKEKINFVENAHNIPSSFQITANFCCSNNFIIRSVLFYKIKKVFNFKKQSN